MVDSLETILTVDVVHEEELAADGFELFLTVRGSAVFAGNSAFEKAVEVKALVGSLAAAGLERSAISLIGLQVDVETGLMSKSSSARYTLRARSKDVDNLAAAVTAVAAAKNATVDRLAWTYREGEDSEQRWLRAAVEKARGRAAAMADALGLVIDRVHRVTTPLSAAEGPPDRIMLGAGYSGPRGGSMSRKRTGPVDLGLEVAPTKTVDVEVRVELVAKPR